MTSREDEMVEFLDGALTDLERRNFRHFTHISLARSYFYFSTPKVACSSILLSLHRAEFADEAFVPVPWDAIHARHYSPLLYPDQISRFGDRVRNGELFKFCFVRNPYTRVASCYYDKVINTEYMSDRLLAALGRKGRDVSFEDFLAYIADEAPAQRDEHYAAQVDHLLMPLIPFDFVGRFENLAADMRTVADRVGIDLTRYEGRLDGHSTDAHVDPAIFTDRARNLVREIYRRDFAEFGYEE